MSIPQIDRTKFGRLRDRIAHHICTFVLNKIATPWYRGMIGGSIRLGLDTAATEEREGVV